MPYTKVVSAFSYLHRQLLVRRHLRSNRLSSPCTSILFAPYSVLRIDYHPAVDGRMQGDEAPSYFESWPRSAASKCNPLVEDEGAMAQMEEECE